MSTLKISKHKHPEYAILASLLEMAHDEFSNHGCNYYELENTPENYALVEAMNKWNSDDPEDQEVQIYNNKIIVMDWFLMAYFSHLFKELAKGEQ